MEKLILTTTAYRTFVNDVRLNRLSHAYMLHLNDVKNMRVALKAFALAFFGESAETVDGRRILKENFPDCKFYPEEGKKFTAEAAAALLDDCAMRPLERDKKLFVICGFNDCSPLVQNKLLKTLEEPPAGVYFILGAATLAPVLDTVKSRVKALAVPPFTEAEILGELERKGTSPLNAEAAASCGGILGAAENMSGGSWFSEVAEAAREVCTTTRAEDIGAVAAKYGDIKYKTELMTEMGLLYHRAVKEKVSGRAQGEVARSWLAPTLIYAAESVDKACADLKFNAFFQGLLYDLMLRITEENDRWLKLQA